MRAQRVHISREAVLRLMQCAVLALVCSISLLLMACGSSSSSQSSASLDTAENRSLLAESGIADRLEHTTQEEIIVAPWLAIEHVQDEDEGELWRIVGSSENELTKDALSTMQVIAVVDWGKVSATYKSSSGNTSTGTSEYADIVYYDAATGAECGNERIKGKELPDTASSTPRYTIDDADVVSTIDERVTCGLSPSYSPEVFGVQDGVLTGVNTDALNKQSTVIIPEGVTELSAEAVAALAKYSKMDHVRLPASLTAINGEIERADSGGFSYQRPVLSVHENSYAQRYAQDGQYVYGLWGTQDAYVPAGVTSLDKVRYDYTNMNEYEFLHVPASVTSIRDGAIGKDCIVVVEPGSYAEKAAKEQGLQWCYEGKKDKVFPASK